MLGQFYSVIAMTHRRGSDRPWGTTLGLAVAVGVTVVLVYLATFVLGFFFALSTCGHDAGANLDCSSSAAADRYVPILVLVIAIVLSGLATFALIRWRLPPAREREGRWKAVVFALVAAVLPMIDWLVLGGGGHPGIVLLIPGSIAVWAAALRLALPP